MFRGVQLHAWTKSMHYVIWTRQNYTNRQSGKLNYVILMTCTLKTHDWSFLFMVSLQVKKKVSRKNTKFLYKTAKLRRYARYPPALKKTSNGESKIYKQYTPCNCKSICGDQCNCLTTENCCEKYCGYVIPFILKIKYYLSSNCILKIFQKIQFGLLKIFFKDHKFIDFVF